MNKINFTGGLIRKPNTKLLQNIEKTMFKKKHADVRVIDDGDKFIITKTVFTLPKYVWKPNDHVKQTLDALNLDPSQCSIKMKKGVTTILDKSGKVIAKASPNSNKGVNYVYVMPKNADSSPRKLAVSYLGEIYEFPKIEKEFGVKFSNAMQENRERMLPKK